MLGFAHVMAGGARLARGLCCQDHAAWSCRSVGPDEGSRRVFLAVSDGIGWAVDNVGRDVPSHNGVGAWLTAELAVAGAASGRDLDQVWSAAVLRGVAESLVDGFAPLWTHLQRRGEAGLQATLVFVLATSERASVHMIGDGRWGVTVRAPASTLRFKDAGRHGQLTSHWTTEQDHPKAGRLRLHRHGELASYENVEGFTTATSLASVVATDAPRVVQVAKVLDLLAPLITIEGPIEAAYAASDGLRHQPATERLLRGPVRTRQELVEVVHLDPTNDDFAVAWAASFAGPADGGAP